MRSGMLPARVVHVHPTRTCNLACLHCYSTSSPAVRSALAVDRLLPALELLRDEGFEILSVSGGEPLVYRGLDALIAGAAAMGYRVHLVTNGLLLTERRLSALRRNLHFVAVSFDGAETLHNRVRGRHDTFRRADEALRVLARGGVPFGLAFGVSHESLADVPWAFAHARNVRAQLLHLRPLVAEGRARTLASEWYLTDEDRDRLVVTAALLDCGPASTPRIQVDLAPAGSLAAAHAQFPVLNNPPESLSLSDVVNPLVIDEQGRFLAFTYGIHQRYTVADLSHDWRSEITRYKEEQLPAIAELLRASLRAVPADTSQVDWFELLTVVSYAQGDNPTALGPPTMVQAASVPQREVTLTRSTPLVS